MPIINAFNNIKDKPLQAVGGLWTGADDLRNLSSMQIGSGGSKVFRSDSSGIWLGASAFIDAPFSVDMEGNIIATTLSLSAYLTKTGTAQPLTGDIRVGTGANVKLDGANARMLVNDGTDDRILIGYQSGGF